MRRMFTIALLATVVAGLSAQQTPQPAQLQQRGAQPLVMDDRTGFEAIFDGRTLNGWDGDTAFWRVENGAIVAESTPQNVVKEGTFLIWRGGEPRDFELKLQFRINSHNSGVQIRSTHLPAGTRVGERTVEGKWVLRGYQADIDFDNQLTALIGEARGRGILALRGQAVYIPAGAPARVIGSLEQNADELKALIKVNDWNQLHLIARGNTIIQILNGTVMSILVDDDTKNRALGGLIGLQMEVGRPMKVEFRNIWLKRLD